MTYHEPVLGWYPSKQKYAIRCSVCGKFLVEFDVSQMEGCGPEAQSLGVSVAENVTLRDIFGKMGDDGNAGSE